MEATFSNGYLVDRGFAYYCDDKLDMDPLGFEVLGDHWIENNINGHGFDLQPLRLTPIFKDRALR